MRWEEWDKGEASEDRIRVGLFSRKLHSWERVFANICNHNGGFRL